MKKSFLLVLLIVALLIFAGCKKQVDLDKVKIDSMKNATPPPAPAPAPTSSPPPGLTPPPSTPPPSPPETAPPPATPPPQEEAPPSPEEVPSPLPPPPEEEHLDVTGDTPLTKLYDFNKSRSMTMRWATYVSGYPDIIEVQSTILKDTVDGIELWKMVSSYSKGGQQYVLTLWLSQTTLKCKKAMLEIDGAAQAGQTCPGLGPFGTTRLSPNVQLKGSQKITVSLGEFEYASKYEGDNMTIWTDGSKPFPLKIVVNNASNILETFELVKW